MDGADVAIIGGGLVALATAAALSARGATVLLIAERHPGEASPAAAGMLAPGVERAGGAAHDFAVAARDLYPSYVEALAEATGVRVALNRAGILELAADASDAEARRASPPAGAEWLDAAALRALEPNLAPAPGALFHPRDGAVDNVTLLRALARLAESSDAIRAAGEGAVAIDLDGDRPSVTLASGRRVAGATVILAAGAWTPLLRGLPRPLPIVPVRGQMIALHASPLHHVTYGGHGYVVPRPHGVSVVGSTMEHVGFDAVTTPDGIARLRAIAARIAPSLAPHSPADQWSGLRPVTPDFLPILGPDPDAPALLYACGHSRNGILLGPLSAECVARVATGEAVEHDLRPFAVTRFDGA